MNRLKNYLSTASTIRWSCADDANMGTTYDMTNCLSSLISHASSSMDTTLIYGLWFNRADNLGAVNEFANHVYSKSEIE